MAKDKKELKGQFTLQLTVIMSTYKYENGINQMPLVI